MKREAIGDHEFVGRTGVSPIIRAFGKCSYSRAKYLAHIYVAVQEHSIDYLGLKWTSHWYTSQLITSQYTAGINFANIASGRI
jgi:hypothetical protein